MSHCTQFRFSYTDEALAVACFKRLGYEPTMGVVAHYNNDALKLAAVVENISNKVLGWAGHLRNVG
jgi:hypothetical protein